MASRGPRYLNCGETGQRTESERLDASTVGHTPSFCCQHAAISTSASQITRKSSLRCAAYGLIARKPATLTISPSQTAASTNPVRLHRRMPRFHMTHAQMIGIYPQSTPPMPDMEQTVPQQIGPNSSSRIMQHSRPSAATIPKQITILYDEHP